MFDFVMTYGPLALQILVIVLGAAVAVLHLIAPLTKTDRDDAALGVLAKALRLLEAALLKLMPKAAKR